MPAPEAVLGWEIGDWHVSHDKLVQYLQTLAGASPRVSLKVIGHTYEQRPLLQLVITAADKQTQLESLRQEHLAGRGPLVLWLGYSVHGNEPSGSNASLLVAYYLAASRSDFVRQLLQESIVIIDPSINPDGLNRFASWANSNAALQPVADPATRLHALAWPYARTNHYWFDLNRDWLPLVHPSSQARVREFHYWLPHVLTDHHEQSRLPGFFFQPGVPARQNPLTPDENFELTRLLASYHAGAMDAAGQPYFTEDSFDDFYFGKGSTYPDINGSVGILFEQRAIRGQELATSNGVETFRTAVANQLAMSLSSLQGSWEQRDRLKRYQAGFHELMLDRARSRDYAGWIVGDDGDTGRARAFLDVLDRHQIAYRPLAGTTQGGGLEFSEGHAWVVPAQQRQFGLLEALMEQRTRFQDNTFYDVSAWTLPLAYNLPFAAVKRLPETAEPSPSGNGPAPDPGARAWVVSWNQLEAPGLLQTLLDQGSKVRVAMQPFSAQTTTGLTTFQRGTLVIQAGIQDPDISATTVTALTEGALAGLEIHSLNSTLTAAGPDLGARQFPRINPVKPLLLGGVGTSSYDVGEVWFLLDRRLGMATPITDIPALEDVELKNYSHLLMADGDYQFLADDHKQAVTRWIRDGGILVAAGRAAGWAESLCFEDDAQACAAEPPVEEAAGPVPPRAYADFEDDKAAQIIGGAIATGLLDLTHPLAFGYQRGELPLFRRGTVELEPSENAYSTPVRYAQEPLLAGFIGPQRLAAMAGQPAVIAERQGKGLVVRFANNPLFRGFWRGTERLYVNALYFGQAIETTELPEFPEKPKLETPRP